ncbi:DUF1854 domain-containing protein [Pseudaquabacterium rugosum]|uniref:DUF1854 domain-containing protein n=1 Tax=Pseudaquabacterium rugosum TaxID=2984194 RepID=A0ABU9BG41_9BURK
MSPLTASAPSTLVVTATASGAVPDLSRDAHGRLLLRRAPDAEPLPVLPVRAFGLSDPGGGLSLVGPDGHEAGWIPRLDALAGPVRALLDEELARREFAPRIEALEAVSTFGTPSTWRVRTDRGTADLVLKAEEDIRRLGDGALLVTDSHGIGYRIADVRALDRRSRKLLERFL